MINKNLNLIFTLVISIVFVGCAIDKEEYVEEQIEIKSDFPINKSITLSFAGDVTMGNYIGSSKIGTFDYEFEQQDEDCSYFFKNVKHIFENDDISIVNLEGTLTNSNIGNKDKLFAFKGNPSYVNILEEGSIEAVSIANNHSLDYFEVGLEDTKSILKDAGIEYFGLGEMSLIEVEGIKVGLLAYNGWDSNYNEKYLEEIKYEIDELKENKADLIITYFHWGEESAYYPNETQKNIAHFAIDNGVDLVLGSHPHVLQGIEKYKNKDNEERYIAYSLSNFCFGGNKNPKDKDSMIYQQTFNFEDENLINIEEPNIIPCSISSTNNRNNYQPTILEGDEYERVMNKITKLSKDLNE
ncbi:MAG: CapA family protein [Peptostreptococcaceae bacterium]